MLGSTSKSGRNSIASISASSMISTRSSARSALKLRDNRVKREQNPRRGHYNGLSLPQRLVARMAAAANLAIENVLLGPGRAAEPSAGRRHALEESLGLTVDDLPRGWRPASPALAAAL